MDVREKQSSEKRLIDANALIAEYDRVHIGEPGKARKLIADALTVDAVEVVRCRDCKFRSSWMMNRNLRYICPESGMFPNCENDFCSYGKRKEGTD